MIEEKLISSRITIERLFLLLLMIIILIISLFDNPLNSFLYLIRLPDRKYISYITFDF